MKNHIDTPKHREVLGARSTEEFIAANAHATYLILLLGAGKERDLKQTILNCEFSSLSATIIWLQERGVIIPADILAYLNIEDTRHA